MGEIGVDAGIADRDRNADGTDGELETSAATTSVAVIAPTTIQLNRKKRQAVSGLSGKFVGWVCMRGTCRRSVKSLGIPAQKLGLGA